MIYPYICMTFPCIHIYIYMYIYSCFCLRTENCARKLVVSMLLGFPANLAFGPPAQVGWVGVGWGVKTFCGLRSSSCNLQHALDATLPPFFL